MCECVCVHAVRTPEREGDTDHRSSPTVSSISAEPGGTVFRSDPRERAYRGKKGAHTTQTRGRGAEKVLLLTEALLPSSLAHIVLKKQKTGGRVRKEEKGIECKWGF